MKVTEVNVAINYDDYVQLKIIYADAKAEGVTIAKWRNIDLHIGYLKYLLEYIEEKTGWNISFITN